MNEATNYADIANMTWDNIPEPKLLPDGSWLLRGRNAAYIAKKENLNARVLFFYQAKEPMSDVDQDALAALGDYDVTENDIVKTFWIEKQSQWNDVKAHLELHGVDVKGQSIPDSLKAFKGSEVISYLIQKSINTANGPKVVNEPTTFEAV